MSSIEAPTAAPKAALPRRGTGRIALAVYVATVVVYAAFANNRLLVHSPDNHFSYLADSLLHGTLEVRCNRTVTHGQVCPPGNGGNDWDGGSADGGSIDLGGGGSDDTAGW